ncbi:SNF2 family N-terminal domain-containing protein [Schizophyllum commune]
MAAFATGRVQEPFAGPSFRTPRSDANTIDLTGDDDDSDTELRSAPSPTRRQATDGAPPPGAFSRGPMAAGVQRQNNGPQSSQFAMSPFASSSHFATPHAPAPIMQQSAFVPNEQPAYHSPYAPQSYQPQASSSSLRPIAPASRPNGNSIIDLTSSPSPPPLARAVNNKLPDSLPPKTPVCIGQLAVKALILYPTPYTQPQEGEPEWVPVRLQYERAPHAEHKETIHIKEPGHRTASGQTTGGTDFGLVEQKVATTLGPMLGKGLIRLDALVKRMNTLAPILDLQLLVHTPKGNIPAVGNYFSQCSLWLSHMSAPFDLSRLSVMHYYNPHDNPMNPNFYAQRAQRPYNGGGGGRWSTPAVSGKSVEVQRSQVDELFKSLQGGDNLPETEPAQEVATTLYPHQKQALTFLLQREREITCEDGNYSSLWQLRTNVHTLQKSWFHAVTNKIVNEEPNEAKSAILADDMGLGKTITCVSLIANTLKSAHAFANTPLERAPAPPGSIGADDYDGSQFAGSVWGMPTQYGGISAKEKAKQQRLTERQQADYARCCRIKAKSRATLIICPLSTVSNWEDQFKEHWRGEVRVTGGASGTCVPIAFSSMSIQSAPGTPSDHSVSPYQPGGPFKVYVYHGNARRPDPAFLADFDAVITTYATLATEFSKQSKSIANQEAECDEDSDNDSGGVEYDERGNPTLRLPKQRAGMKRKKPCGTAEQPSALQSIHWFRVVLDEAHCIKETSTVASRACCDLMADRRLCLTGTPVQNKLDDVYALIKFLRLEPLDDKNVWTDMVGSPVKFAQPIGIARLQTIMKCITLRRTKETKADDGRKILNLPPRRDELRYLKFDEQEQTIYDEFFQSSKAEFNEMSDNNEVMKNYVGILQKILRLRQICDHFELVQDKEAAAQICPASYENLVAEIMRDGLTFDRAMAVFTLFREASTTQCVECGYELCKASENTEGFDCDNPPPAKRGRKPKNPAGSSRGPTRASSPTSARPIVTRCQHLFCIECYKHSVCPGWPSVPPDTRRVCSVCQTCLCPGDAVEVKVECGEAAMAAKKKTGRRERRQKGSNLANFRPSTKVRALMGDLIMFSRANPHSANYDPESIEVRMTDGQGNEIDEGVTKTVVFSQWTTMLDKIEEALDVAGIRYDRLDGTMKRDDRTRAMDALKYDPGCEVLLVSLKAGGVGLNLTAASRVYLMDPYWNPAVENQAVDRIHRLGQTRPVTTVKLIIENTIEARLLEVQKKKTALANMTLDRQSFSKAELMQRRMEELQDLFS